MQYVWLLKYLKYHFYAKTCSVKPNKIERMQLLPKTAIPGHARPSIGKVDTQSSHPDTTPTQDIA